MTRPTAILIFVEEMIRMLIDEGVIVERPRGDANEYIGWQVREGADLACVVVPESVQTLLIARIDRIPELQYVFRHSLTPRPWLRDAAAALAEAQQAVVQ